MAHDHITAQSWTHKIYVPTQNRFVHSGQEQFLENLERTPQTILPPSYHIDNERNDYDVEEYDKKLCGLVHLDPKDGIYYAVRKVFERDGRLVRPGREITLARVHQFQVGSSTPSRYARDAAPGRSGR